MKISAPDPDRARNRVLAVMAHRYRLVIATGNVSDFEASGVRVFNPFE